jgi:hypothetical protein
MTSCREGPVWASVACHRFGTAHFNDTVFMYHVCDSGVTPCQQPVSGYHLHLLRGAHQVPALPAPQQRHAGRQGCTHLWHGPSLCQSQASSRVVVPVVASLCATSVISTVVPCGL